MLCVKPRKLPMDEHQRFPPFFLSFSSAGRGHGPNSATASAHIANKHDERNQRLSQTGELSQRGR
jgi:hypothetical protein